MTDNNQIGVRQGMHSETEETLQLLAQLPAPADLEERLHAALKKAPRTGEVLSWPGSGGLARGWINGPFLRGAAAAAIVMVVMGGSWAVYSHVQPAPVPQAIAQPRVIAPRNGFSSANAMRTPTTLNGPTVKQPTADVSTKATATAQNSAKKTKRKRHAAQTPAR